MLKTTLTLKHMLALPGFVCCALGSYAFWQYTIPVISGWTAGKDLPVGTLVAIELRPPLPSGFTSLYMKGTLKTATEHWLVITDKTKPEADEIWISRDSVLVVFTGKTAKEYKGLTFTPTP